MTIWNMGGQLEKRFGVVNMNVVVVLQHHQQITIAHLDIQLGRKPGLQVNRFGVVYTGSVRAQNQHLMLTIAMWDFQIGKNIGLLPKGNGAVSMNTADAQQQQQLACLMTAMLDILIG